MKMLRLFLAAIVIIALAFFWEHHASGQIVDLQSAVNKKIEDQGVTGAVALSWDRRTGNTDLTAGSVSGMLRYKHHTPETVFILYKREYGQKSQEEYLNNYFYHIRYRWLVTDFFNLELFGQSDHNKFRGYTQRNLYGAGPLLKWADEKNYKFYTGLAYMSEFEDATMMDEKGENKHHTERLSASVLYSQEPLPHLDVSLSLYYQPNLHDSKDRRTSINGSVGYKLTEDLSYSLTASVTADSDPGEGVAKTDMKYKNVLQLSF